jgi:hypothetical protein
MTYFTEGPLGEAETKNGPDGLSISCRPGDARLHCASAEGISSSPFVCERLCSLYLHSLAIHEGKKNKRLARKQHRKVKAMTEKISGYAWNMHKRFPTGEVVVGEKDLAEQLRKHPDTVPTALNMLLDERKVQKTSLTGHWKLNV